MFLMVNLYILMSSVALCLYMFMHVLPMLNLVAYVYAKLINKSWIMKSEKTAIGRFRKQSKRKEAATKGNIVCPYQSLQTDPIMAVNSRWPRCYIIPLSFLIYSFFFLYCWNFCHPEFAWTIFSWRLNSKQLTRSTILSSALHDRHSEMRIGQLLYQIIKRTWRICRIIKCVIICYMLYQDCFWHVAVVNDIQS